MSSKITQFFVELMIVGEIPTSFVHIASGGFGLLGTFKFLNSFSDVIKLNVTDFIVGETFGSSFTYIGSGSLQITGTLIAQQSFQIISSGKISLSNILSKLRFSNRNFSFTWKVNRRDRKTISFSWSTTTSRKKYFYRVVGKTRKPNYKPITVPNYRGKVSSVVLMYANSVSDVCKKLRERNFVHPIAKIEQYTNNLNPSVPYTELTDVTPSYRLLACADFFLDFDLLVSAKVSANLLYFARIIKIGGNIRFTGTADLIII